MKFRYLLTAVCTFLAGNACLYGEHSVVDAVPPAAVLQAPFGKSDEQAFKEPPKAFFPETWFHLMGGNIDRKGITADLEAIKAAGISGIQLFHGRVGGAPWPGIEGEEIKSLTPEWDAMIRHVADECRRLGLRFTMQNCPGWATSGGPWITPENAMRNLAWSRTDVKGGGSTTLQLPVPQPSGEDWRDYRDVAVIAFPTPEGDSGEPLVPVKVTSNREEQAWEKCLAGDGRVRLRPSGKDATWVDITFAQPETLRTVEFPSIRSFNHAWSYEPGVTITVSAMLPEGPRMVARVNVPASNWQDNMPFSIACADSTAQTYRIEISNRNMMSISSLRLFSAARQNNWEGDAAWAFRDLDRRRYPRQAKESWVNPAAIVDLSDRLSADGQLNWTPPAGEWTVLRIGHVNSGHRNNKAAAEATGWESDKFSKAATDAHFAGYIGRLATGDGPIEGLLQGVLIDSWEARTQTWTPQMMAEFKERRGYDLAAWLPALMGYTVGDPDTTSRFLRDWRATINDLVVANYFGRMAELSNNAGLALSFETASGDVFPADILEYYKHADVPMCEFWQPHKGEFVYSLNFKPARPTASAARMYGKPRVAAEALTSFELTWDERLSSLKTVADIYFAQGVTHPVYHTYTHNPSENRLPPGTSFGRGIGTPFLRDQTWWWAMPDFNAYMSRCSYLLERGQPVSDVLWYLGDELGAKPDQLARFPEGYAYDYCNPDALLNRLSVKDGNIVTPEGISYRVLWLPSTRKMLPQTLEKIVQLVKDGATVVGNRPQAMEGLGGGKDAQARFDNAVNTLWGSKDAKGIREVGKGRVIADIPLPRALRALKIEPDVLGGVPMWVHREADGADWYFVAANADTPFKGVADFRADGIAELWNPLTGERFAANVSGRKDGRTQVALDLVPGESVFVVFRKDGDVKEGALAAQFAGAARSVQPDTRWELSFPEGWDAPQSVVLEELIPWKDMDMSPAAKAFSGTATYRTTFTLGALPAGERVMLNLGNVKEMARVRVNGTLIGTVWSPPYQIDVTKALRVGKNTVEVNVTSTWFNRLVHDANLPNSKRKTWTLAGPKKEEALRPFGLLGPVSLDFEAPALTTGSK